MKRIAIEKFSSYETSVPRVLDSLEIKELLSRQKKIILKPNLTCCKPPPVTTPAKFVEEVLKYCRAYSRAEILIAEGSGGSTNLCYENLGYRELEKKYPVKLINLNQEEVTVIKSPLFKKFDYIHFPRKIQNGFLISLPVLKEHGASGVTISLKNMLGCYPGKFYGGDRPGSWKTGIHKWPVDYSIHDILVCKFPDLSVVDASVGQLKDEVYGTPKEFGLLLAGDPLEVDKKGCEVLGKDWTSIDHIKWAEELR